MKYVVGQRTYTERRMKAAKAKRLYGETDMATGTIEIAPNLPPDIQREILLHELLHALMWESGLAQRLGPELDEEVCANLARWLLMLLRDNPGLAARLGAT